MAMLYFTGEGRPAVCKQCHEAWYENARPPTKRGYPRKPKGCNHGVTCTVTYTDGNGLDVTRRTCQRCGYVERTIPSTAAPPKIPPLPTS